MKNLTTMIITIIVMMYSSKSVGQNVDQLMKKAYVTNSKTLWKQAVTKSEGDLWTSALAHYGLLIGTMSDQDEALFDEYIDRTLDLLKKLEEEPAYTAEALAIRSGVYGLIMAYSPWKGMVYGYKSSSCLEKAYELAPKSPIVLSLQANSLYYTPTAFGGDKVEASKKFEQSVALFEEGAVNDNWMYLYTLANLGQAYHAIDKDEQALAIYNQALELAPDFYYVSKVLKPRVQKK